MAGAAALLLAVTFGWAGLSKLGRRSDTARSFAALGLPAPSLLARTVPVVEVALAAGLVVVPAAAARASILLLVVFTAVVGAAVRRGVEVGCACFGAASSEPVSAAQVVRNAGLVTAAVVATQAGSVTFAGLVTLTAAASGWLVVVRLAELRQRTGSLWRAAGVGAP